AAFTAICSLGAIAVPINLALRLEEQCSILNNSGARLAVVESDIRNALLTDALEKLQQLKDIVVVDRNQVQASPGSLKGLQDKAAETKLEDFADPAEHQPAFILYTSGSTGE